jgi:DNA-binding NtrC family response regulator
MARILIVDDDPQLRQSFQKILTAEGHVLLTANSGEAGIALMKESQPDLVIMDVRMPGISGLEAFKVMHGLNSKLPVIIMTAYASTDTAIEATKMGAFDYVLKPFEIPDILDLIEKALQTGRFMRAQVQLNAPSRALAPEAIVGQSAPMREVYKAIGRAAPTDATILICGESGTGKELVARAIFQHSLRADKPFLVINCVAIPETLLESELFGYEKGAFTGAVSKRVGKIEQANFGTVFLDEIGDMPYSIQAKILRLLQERSIERLGGRQPIPVNVRIIAATNRDLEAAVSEGRFREDLYYRLKVVSLNLPPLRERIEDLPLLTDYFLQKFCREMGIGEPGRADAVLDIFKRHPWPGNVRELANTIQKALIFSQGAPLTGEDIVRTMNENHVSRKPSRTDVEPCLEPEIKPWVRQRILSSDPANLFDSLMDYFGAIIIGQALTITQGNRSQAAKMLGLSRPTLLARIEKYGLKIQTGVTGPQD